MKIPFIFGLQGPQISDEEARFFEDSQPSGFILFARNCVTKSQLTALINDLKSLIPDAAIMVDQEGGRVMRLKPPEWPEMPPAKLYGDMYDRSPIMAGEALKSDTIQAAQTLKNHGFTVNLTPCCDLFVPNAHAVIGDRAFHEDPAIVAHLAAIQARCHLESGIQPVMKHMPGHGRASLDSHNALPVIETCTKTMQLDMQPFVSLASQFGADMWGMVCHCVYPDLDPSGLPAGCSKFFVQDIIRTKIGLNGLLLSDDICMSALQIIGDPAQRAKACLDAGCDLVLHCDGNLADMRCLADSV